MRLRTLRRPAVLLLAAGAFALLVPWVALAANGRGDADRPIVVITGWLDVAEGVTVDDAVILDGDLTVAGRVTGTALAVNGDVTVDGIVDGDVASLSGRVIVGDGGVVRGSVTSSLPPQIAPGATVDGPVTRNQFDVNAVLFGRVAFWVAASVASLLVGLLLILFVPRAAETAARDARTRVGPSVGWGLLLFAGVPVLGVVALVTLVGALFGVALLTGMVLLYLLAYAVGAHTVGRLLLKDQKPAVAFLAGWLILRVLALVPVLGGFLFVAAAIWGFGGLAIAAFRAGRDRTAGSGAQAPPQTPDTPIPAAPPPIPPAP